VGRRIVTAGALGAVVLFCALTAAVPATATTCTPTLGDPFGPFGRGAPPERARIGTGHVLTGVVLSSLD